MAARLSIRMLGSFQVSREGEPLSGFASDKVRALLAYLALSPRPHRREAQAGPLWPEFPERSAPPACETMFARIPESQSGGWRIVKLGVGTALPTPSASGAATFNAARLLAALAEVTLSTTAWGRVTTGGLRAAATVSDYRPSVHPAAGSYSSSPL